MQHQDAASGIDSHSGHLNEIPGSGRADCISGRCWPFLHFLITENGSVGAQPRGATLLAGGQSVKAQHEQAQATRAHADTPSRFFDDHRASSSILHAPFDGVRTEAPSYEISMTCRI